MKTKATFFLYLSFAFTVFLSAFLLFQVQPIIGKYILPWFGGTSFVWLTTLLFFQTLLLGGYFYSYLIAKLRIKYQLFFHGIVIIAAVVITIFLFNKWSSPITPGVDLKLPENVSPPIQVLAILLVSVGLPYFLLSTTSTLLQKWFSSVSNRKSPYPLYALSNAGSLLAIISYPIFIEPFLPLQKQGYIWSAAFVGLCLLLILCSAQMIKSETVANALTKTKSKNDKIVLKSKKSHWSLWLFLPAVSSLMLLAGTNQLTQGIAPIPFLWLVPLGLYLLSFILCFSEKSWYKRNFYSYCFLSCVPFVIAILIQPPVFGIFSELFLFTILLFSSFMICHGELFSSKPEPKNLNAFYLIMALGSVIGAIVVAIIAPIFFVGLFWEFLLGLFFMTLIATLTLSAYKNSFLYRRLNFGFTSQKEITVFLIVVVSFFYFILSAASYIEQNRDTIGIWRNFYGTLRVLQKPPGKIRCLLNGKIIHGCQSLTPSQKMKPTTYYGENGIGLAIKSLREENLKSLRIGAIGLGIGTIASYGQKSDVIHFYELNPLDVQIAKTDFSYITDTQADIEITIGDGRLSLENELQAGRQQNYNLIVIDAFNDDSIPVHLLTKEAFELYSNQLASDGIIAVHISNTYLNLEPVLAKAAHYQNLEVLFIDAPPANDNQTRSKWAFLTHDKNLFTKVPFKSAKKDTTPINDIRLWTDDYSNLFQLLKY
jgi:hypothetical protein